MTHPRRFLGMSQVTRELIFNVVIFVTVVAVCSTYLAVAVYRWNPFEKTSTVTMQVTDTNLILDGTGVFVNGVRIGQVSDVHHTPEGATLRLTYPAHVKIPVNSPLHIGLQSALGEPHLNFVPAGGGGGPHLRDGDTVAAKNVLEPESIPGIFDQMQNMMAVVAVDPLAKLLRTAFIALEGTEEATGRISDGTRLIAGILASRTPQVRAMFAATQRYNQNLVWAMGAVPQFLESWSKIIAEYTSVIHAAGTLVEEADMFGNLKNVVDPMLVRLTEYLVKIIPPTMEAFGPIMPIVTAVNQTIPQINLSEFLSDALQLFGAGNGMRVVVTPVK